MRRLARLIRNNKAATAVEYGLILALMVLAMLAGLTSFARTTINMWNGVSDNVTSHGG
ncbi:MAG TPA: Flp family type IVb pilin [Allosphingosinicella sp.]|jgi:pilus assembly protein Flp/PilA